MTDKGILGQRSPKTIKSIEAVAMTAFFVVVKLLLAYYWLVKIKQSCYNAQDDRRKLTD